MHCHLCRQPIEDLFWKSLLPLVSPDMPYPEQTRLLTDYGINTMFPLFGRKPEWVEVCDGCNGRYFYFLSLEIL